MRSTMQETPLGIPTLLRFASTVYSGSQVHTVTADGLRTASFAEVGARAAQLAHALHDDLGIRGDQRVATFMWNNQEHLEAYFAVPSMGAVLHTLNIRLYPDQVTYIANHAEDKVVLVDGSLIPLLARVLPGFETVEHVVVVGAGDPAPLEAAGKQIHRYEDLLAGKPTTYDWPEFVETDAAAMCYTSGTTGNPKGVVYSHRSIYLHSMQVTMPQSFQLTEANRVLTIVPMFHAMAWGIPYAALMSGASLVMPDRFLQAPALVRAINEAKADFAGAVPTIWADVLNHLDATGEKIPTLQARGGRRLGGAAGADAGLRRALRHAHHPRLGDDRDLAAGLRLPSAGRHRGRAGLVLPRDPGPFPGRGAGAAGRPGRLDRAQRRRGGRRAGSARPVDRRVLLPRRGPRALPRRLAAHRRRRHDHPRRLPDADRPGEGRHQVRRRVDLLGGVGEPPDGARRRGRGHRGRRPGPALAGASPGRGGAARGRPGPRQRNLREYLSGLIPKWQLPERWTFLTPVPKTSVGKFDKKEVRRAYAAGELEVTVL